MANEVKLFIRVDDSGTVKIKQFGDTAKKEFNDVASTGTSAFSSLKDGILGVGAVLGTALSFDALKEMFTSTTELGEQFNVLAKRTGLSVEEFSRLNYAAHQLDVEQEALLMGIRKLTVAMNDAREGSKEKAKAFDELGISVTTTGGKVRPVMAVFGELADKIRDMTDAESRTITVSEIFGERFGTQLLPMLTSGSDEIKKLIERSDQLGATWTTETAESADKLNDKLFDLETRFGALKRSMTFKAAPFVEDWMEGADQLMNKVTGGAYQASYAYDKAIAQRQKDIEKLKDDLETETFSVISSGRLPSASEEAAFRSGVKARIKELQDEITWFQNAKNEVSGYNELLRQSSILERTRAAGLVTADEGGTSRTGKTGTAGTGKTSKTTQALQPMTDWNQTFTSFEGRKLKDKDLDASLGQDDAAQWEVTFEQAQDHKRRELELDQTTADERVRINQEMWQALQYESIAGGYALMSLGQGQSRSLFNAGKALSIASATIAGYEAAVKSYEYGADIGGPPLGAVFAALALAQTGAQIAHIKNTKYEARALGGPVTAGDTYLVGERGPELFTARKSGSITPNSEITRSASFSFSFDFRNARIMDESALMQRVKETCIEAYNEHIAEGGTVRKSAWA